MGSLKTIWLRLQHLFSRDRFSRELDKEMRFHLEEQINENLAAGMAPGEARRAAFRAFGNGTAAKEDAWEAWGWSWLEQIVQDIRYGLRQLRKTPGFTATAVLTLALGIGVNAAIFTLVHAVILNNLPVTDPHTLVRLGDNNDCCVNGGALEDGDFSLFPTASYELLKQNLPEFQELAAMQAGFEYRPVTARRDGAQQSARSVMGEFVSGNYFHTFGLRPAAGRLFSDGDDRKGAPLVAMMSYATWKNTYAADPSVVGSTFWINTKAVTIAGVAPPGFFGDRLTTTPPEFFLPIQTMPVLANVAYVDDPDARWLYMIGRLKPGVNLTVLQEKVGALVKQSVANSDTYSKQENKKLLDRIHVVLTPGGSGIQQLRDQYESNLKLLLIASGLVLLIACANIANLLLVRGMQRKVELSVRTALGAARGRIVRQLLTESVVLSVLGGAAGLVVAYLGSRMLLDLAFPAAQNVPIDARPSPMVLAFTCALVLLTGILFGIAPAWIAAKTDPADALRAGGRGTTSGASLLQRSLVVFQAALSLVLLVGAGLFSQSLHKLENKDLKLDATNRYIVHINPQAAGYSQTQLVALYRTIEQSFHALPGVTNVGLSTYTPMEDNNWGNSIQIQGKPNTNSGASLVKVSPEYFNSVGTKVLMGRSIGPQDIATSPVVAVVNEEFVKGFFAKGENPIGHHFGSEGPQSTGDYEIVGVVNDTAYTSARWLDHRMYFPALLQRPPSDKSPIETDQSLYAGAVVLQTSAPISNMEQLARETLAQINPNLAVVKFQTFADQISDRFNDDRLLARLTALFGALALLLATIGLYGVTAYSVARRTSEIGIRMALGAERTNVVSMILRGALGQTVLGLAIGIPAAVLCVRFLQSQLFEIKGLNLGVLATAILALALASALAGLIPASRAASTDPAQTLRAE
ncbi:MAG TPA: ABC transporter permease [Verrucomicrobiae bacterium]|nr:ABC transporter permease [Verrucomicrobiae bacterium]